MRRACGNIAKAGPGRSAVTFYCIRPNGHRGFCGFHVSAIEDLDRAWREIRGLKLKLARARRGGKP